jgi:hypothetical protein
MIINSARADALENEKIVVLIQQCVSIQAAAFKPCKVIRPGLAVQTRAQRKKTGN